MTAGAALRAALSDFYEQSWRLLVLNAALGAFVLAVAVAGLWLPALWAVGLLAAGPLAAALMHCAVQVTRTEELRLGFALDGLRLHWRRGLTLAAAALAALVLGVVAVVFYGRGDATAWPLAVVAAYLLGLFGVYQLLLWPLAVAERARPLGLVARAAFAALLRRPVQAVVLFAALAAVNAAGVVAALLPFLTLTLAYSFLAAAHFALPPTQEA